MKVFFKVKLMILFISVLQILGCKQNKLNREVKALKSDKGNIVLIFNNPVMNWKFEVENRGYIHFGKYEISYVKNSPILEQWSPNYLKKSDTLIITNIEKNIEIRHKYKGIDEFSYLFKPNDTIIFKYQNQLPIADVINRKVKKYDVNFEILKRSLIVKDDFPSEVKFNSSFFYLIENNQSENQLEDYKDKQFQRAKNELFLEKNLLDSLRYNYFISEDIYNYYNNKNLYNLKNIEIKKDISNRKDYHLKKVNDSLLSYSFYTKYLKTIVNLELEKKTKIINFSNAKIPDYRKVYDSINSSKLFTQKVKKYLSFLWLDLIVNNFSTSDINEYFQKFKHTYKDSILIDYFNQEYKLTIAISDNLDLKDSKNNKTNFKKIIKSNKGKLIYIDFWASWCAPCRRAMPSSKKLREEYRNKEVTFVYLALNDKDKNWKRAINEDGINEFDNNYIIENSKSSKLIEDLNLKTIPRYILYDKNGKLVHKNAPGPEGNEIRKLLDTYLNK